MDEEHLAEYAPIEELSAEDAAALDALVEAGMDSAGVGDDGSGGAGLGERAARIGGLLGLLDCAVSLDDSLADVTFVRVLQARKAGRSAGRGRVLAEMHVPAEPALCMDDEEALDAWVMGGYEAGRVPGSLRERARRHQRLAEMVAWRVPSATEGDESGEMGDALGALTAQGGGRLDAHDSELLIDRTLAAVQAEIDRRAESMAIEPARPRRGSLRLADVMSIAAVLLLGSAVLFPVMTAVREQSRRAVCSNNMHLTAQGMSVYAGEYRDSMPMTTASLGSGRWWDVGRPQHSNSANLYTLARTGHAKLESLACPGNRAAPTAIVRADAKDWRELSEVSYSYQIMFGPARPAWNNGMRMVILADRSPVVPRAMRGELIDPFANALNHGGAGQHVLFNDGSVVWMRTPVLENGDNIWLPRAVEIQLEQMSGRGTIRPLSGREIPEAADDVFLGP